VEHSHGKEAVTAARRRGRTGEAPPGEGEGQPAGTPCVPRPSPSEVPLAGAKCPLLVS
jgi:hypothetical protein